ncbi:MAG: hypothetical protein JRH20_30640 [Deltaproteobacteria bacterium]|nr:hypothetical protein [Deltaproteobacteria bacterium]
MNASVHAMHFPSEDELLVETREPDTCYPLLASAALERGVKVRSLLSPDNNLQAVFEYLTRDRGPEGVAPKNGGAA